MMRGEKLEAIILSIRNNICHTFKFDFDKEELRINEVIEDADLSRIELLRLLNALADSHVLTTFSVFCEMIDQEIIDFFIQILKKNTNLVSFAVSVRLSDRRELVQLSSHQMEGFAIGVGQCQRLKRLSVSGFSLKGSDFQRLSDVVSSHVSLTELELKSGAISEVEVSMLSASLIDNRQLQKLDLSSNDLSHAIVSGLCVMLFTNQALQTLRLRHNRLDDNSARLLFKALSANRRLSCLDVSDNQFTDEGAEYFSELLNINPVLRKLLLSGHRFSLAPWIKFATALTMNATIQVLSLQSRDDDPAMMFLNEKVITPLLRLNNEICIRLAEYPLPVFIQRSFIAALLNEKFKIYNKHIPNPEVFFGMEKVKNEVTTGICSLKQLVSTRVFDLCMAGVFNQAAVNRARIIGEVGGYLTEMFNPIKLMKKPDISEPEEKPKVDVKRMAARLRFEFAGQKKEKEDGALVLTWSLRPV